MRPRSTKCTVGITEQYGVRTTDTSKADSGHPRARVVDDGDVGPVRAAQRFRTTLRVGGSERCAAVAFLALRHRVGVLRRRRFLRCDTIDTMCGCELIEWHVLCWPEGGRASVSAMGRSVHRLGL